MIQSFVKSPIGSIGVIGVKPCAILALAILPVPAHAKPPKLQQDVEWMWQYTPDAAHPDGRENDLAQDLRFKPLLDQYLTAPQTFWGQPIAGRWRSLSNTALDHLSVPDKVLADDNRYISISGCTVHFCPARGLLWVDLNGSHHLVVFCAIDWTKQGAPTSDPDAEYTALPLLQRSAHRAGRRSRCRIAIIRNRIDSRPPPAAQRSPAPSAAGPPSRSPARRSSQDITHAVIVDPDGTEHEVSPSGPRRRTRHAHRPHRRANSARHQRSTQHRRQHTILETAQMIWFSPSN